MFYIDLFRALQGAGVRYLVVGGVAMNLHGIPRSTADIDVFAALDGDNVARLLGVLERFEYAPAVPVRPEALADPVERSRWREGKNMLALCFRSRRHPAVPIDVLIAEPVPFEDAYGRRKVIRPAGADVEISVSSEEDLAAMKRAAGREQDLLDLDALRRKRREKE